MMTLAANASQKLLPEVRLGKLAEILRNSKRSLHLNRTPQTGNAAVPTAFGKTKRSAIQF